MAGLARNRDMFVRVDHDTREPMVKVTDFALVSAPSALHAGI